jgi:hypothetical protein
MGLLSTVGNIVGQVSATAILTKALKKGGGAMPPAKPGTSVNFYNGKGNTVSTDTRVKIKVPSNYLQNYTTGPLPSVPLLSNGGIIFPYTPQISIEHKADYESQNPTHSNLTQYFYKHSSVGSISIQGKFSVQNEVDAGVYISTVHLLRALTKMRYGIDGDAGSPPPVCRLYAYGRFMLDYVPVAITSFRLELPDGVDYFTAGSNPLGGFASDSRYGIDAQTSVPTVSTISVTCIPMFSRQDMLKYGVQSWLESDNLRKNMGFL